MKFYALITLFLLYPFVKINSNQLIAKSILILDEKIPKECGIKILIDDEFETDVSIKKNKENQTLVNLSIKSENISIENYEFSTNSIKLRDLLLIKKKEKNLIAFENNLENDLKSNLFQEILIGGATININNNSYKLKGPIDSKVRLEYLFCTGEMFHPKYKK